jgi:hypothetical protein
LLGWSPGSRAGASLANNKLLKVIYVDIESLLPYTHAEPLEIRRISSLNDSRLTSSEAPFVGQGRKRGLLATRRVASGLKAGNVAGRGHVTSLVRVRSLPPRRRPVPPAKPSERGVGRPALGTTPCLRHAVKLGLLGFRPDSKRGPA